MLSTGTKTDMAGCVARTTVASNTANEEGSNRMYLDEANLFPFFSIHRHKNNGTLYHIPGHERIPHNWFRRPLASEFSLLDIVRNVLTSSAAYPEFLSVGGNAGKVNTYAGVNVGDLTGGLLNVAKLTSNQDALSCFLYQGVVQSVIPTQLKFIVSAKRGSGGVNKQVAELFANPFPQSRSQTTSTTISPP